MNGNRSIDTAQAYGNEEGVGQAIVKAVCQERNFSLPQRSGSAMQDMKKQRLRFRNP